VRASAASCFLSSTCNTKPLLFNSFLEQVMEIEEEYYDGSRGKNFPNPKFCFRAGMSTS
jgi:hypothetical protein